MSTATLTQPTLTSVASLPANYFLENFALRADNSALIRCAGLIVNAFWRESGKTDRAEAARFGDRRGEC
jgi:hypothetical protein